MMVNTPVDFNWIKSSREIRALRKDGSPVRGRNVVAWVVGNRAGMDAASVGIVLSKGYRNAVDRNLAKRRGRGCIIDLREMLKPGHEYLIEYRPGAARINYQKLVNEVKDILSRTGIA